LQLRVLCVGLYALSGCGDVSAGGVDARIDAAVDSAADAPLPLRWHDYTSSFDDPHPLYGVYVIAPDNVWFASGVEANPPVQGSALVDHWNGQFWQIYGVSGVAFPLRRVWALGTAAFFAGSNSDQSLGAVVAAKEDPMSGTTPALWVLRGQYGLTGIAGVASGSYMVVGSAAFVTSSVPSGDPWSIMPSYSTPFAGATAVWLSAMNDGWAASTTDHMLHWDGNNWSVANGAPGAPLAVADMWGFSATDVWGVGGDASSSVIIHWDGGNWTVAQMDALGRLEGVWGPAPNDLWAVGASGRISHWDGSSWSAVGPFTSAHLYAVRGSGAEDVWVVGESGTILRYAR
jgi:hypothetical protein